MARKSSTKKETSVQDPQIPQDTLSEFLQEEVSIREISNVMMVEDNFLWEKNGTRRHRLNVWIREEQEGRYCPKVYIGHSFFLHYKTEDDMIVDKTIEATISLEDLKKGPF